MSTKFISDNGTLFVYIIFKICLVLQTNRISSVWNSTGLNKKPSYEVIE